MGTLLGTGIGQVDPSLLGGWVTPSNIFTIIGTVILGAVGLVISVRTSNAARKNAAIAHAQFERLEEERELEVPSKFAVWVQSQQRMRHRNSDGDVTYTYKDVWLVDVAVRNFNDSSIFDIAVMAGTMPGPEDYFLVGLIPFAPPHQEMVLTMAYIQPENCRPVNVSIPLITTFMDAKNRMWIRDHDGQVARLRRNDGENIAIHVIHSRLLKAKEIDWCCDEHRDIVRLKSLIDSEDMPE
jgi:hypothetical protein